ncbi:MAG TPA: medium chain dehydrogenase/reductase family protein [Pseudonocardiaceae bacterium]|jgi:NADPH:quinone reductase-like Zn-dependent oxidoreductase|nr:medium chain dehydrogenase/reductase family protein [Pseudonocardiaceae bacterium]
METVEIVLAGVGEPETLQVRRRDLPAPGPEQAVVRMDATGVSFAEQSMRRGMYYDQPPFPFVPGYDLVGTVEAVGERPASGIRVGRRVAALTKIGGWAQRLLLDTGDLVPVPDGVAAAEAETVIVNGLTAWRVLHRTIRPSAGQTIVVFAAGGGVGSVLVQLARQAGLRVIGTAGPSQQDRLRSMGVIPIDYRTEDVPARVRALAPDGVAAVVDNVGGPGAGDSWRLLAPGGTLVVLSDMSMREAKYPMLRFLKTFGRMQLWNLLPNRKNAHFFNLWAGHKRHLERYRAELRADLTRLFGLLAEGTLVAPIDSEYPLSKAADALRRAEAGGLAGKVIIVPDEIGQDGIGPGGIGRGQAG